MLQKIIAKIKHCRASHILALLFAAYIFYVGTAALPFFCERTLSFLRGQLSMREFIDQTDEQYHSMLTTSTLAPLLQNKTAYINMNGQFANLVGQDYINNLVRLTNGHLTYLQEESFPAEEIESAAKTIATLCYAQKEQGKHFLFVLAPSQICKYEELLPPGYHDATNSDSDLLLQYLQQMDVPYLDLREKMHEDSLSHDTAFFVTDHHWTPQAGFWAYAKILGALEETAVISPVDPFYTSADHFQFEIHENCFLGAFGRRTGLYYAGLDDFCMIKPNFPTDISVRIPDKQIDMRGLYEQVCNAPMPDNNEAPDYFHSSLYSLYGYDDNAYTRRRTENAPDSSRLLMLGDSFGNVPFSLMSLYFASCDELDMRYYADDFRQYYESYDPDIVIMLVNAHDIISENTNYVFFPEA